MNILFYHTFTKVGLTSPHEIKNQITYNLTCAWKNNYEKKNLAIL